VTLSGFKKARRVTHVKVCGITRLEDARLAADLGASALGFVFWPGSPRFIDPYDAREIVRRLPPFVAAVGVFVDPAEDYVRGVVSLVKLTAAQLHGEAARQLASRLRMRVITALPLPDGSGPEVADVVPVEHTLLLDAQDSVRVGGTGRPVDWTVAAAIARTRRVILAGGLRAENVVEAIHRVRPYAVDVSSGVEERPGVKNAARLEAFIGAVRRATETAGARAGRDAVSGDV